MFINYAHRGASAYAPENTLSAFYMGLQMGAHGLETDVRMLKDETLVLFHDTTLERVTNMRGAVASYTWQELREAWVTGPQEWALLPDRMVTLADFLHIFGNRKIHFAIEIKDMISEKAVWKMVQNTQAKYSSIYTSFQYENLVRLRELDSAAILGFLTPNADANTFAMLKEANIQQLCLKVDAITPAIIEYAQAKGVSVRAWGIEDEASMRRVCHSGVDGGMTINFPDKLTAYLKVVEESCFTTLA